MRKPDPAKRGRRFNLYLTRERLELLGPDPSEAIYRLIDALDGPIPDPPSAVQETSTAIEALAAPSMPSPAQTLAHQWVCRTCGVRNPGDLCTRCHARKPNGKG